MIAAVIIRPYIDLVLPASADRIFILFIICASVEVTGLTGIDLSIVVIMQELHEVIQELPVIHQLVDILHLQASIQRAMISPASRQTRAVSNALITIINTSTHPSPHRSVDRCRHTTAYD